VKAERGVVKSMNRGLVVARMVLESSSYRWSNNHGCLCWLLVVRHEESEQGREVMSVGGLARIASTEWEDITAKQYPVNVGEWGSSGD